MLSPKTKQKAALRCDRDEQQRLDEIQAASAAYYAYKPNESDMAATTTTSKPNWHGRRHLLRIVNDNQVEKNMDFKVFTLAEIREKREREKLAAAADVSTSDVSQSTEDTEQVPTSSTCEQDMSSMPAVESAEKSTEPSSPSLGKRKFSEVEFKQSTAPVKLRRSLNRNTKIEPRVDEVIEGNRTECHAEQLNDEQLNNELFSNKQLNEECPADEYISLDATAEDIIKDIDDFLV